MPARFVVRLTPSFQRDLEALARAAQERILGAIRRLETSPFGPPPTIKKLKGKGAGQRRLEVWPYRVRYDIQGDDVVLYRVRHLEGIPEGRFLRPALRSTVRACSPLISPIVSGDPRRPTPPSPSAVLTWPGSAVDLSNLSSNVPSDVPSDYYRAT